MSNAFYQPLSRPLIYRMAQWALAPGATPVIVRRLARLLSEMPPAPALLDAGCGPASWLFHLGQKPVGLDLSPAYLREYAQTGARGVIASAGQMPFADHSFAGVFSLGLLHHLPDELAAKTIAECLRVAAVPGWVLLLDGVLPRSNLRRPLAAGIRRLDRGRFMRREEKLAALLPQRESWRLSRFSYSLTGLEMLVCARRKES